LDLLLAVHQALTEKMLATPSPAKPTSGRTLPPPPSPARGAGSRSPATAPGSASWTRGPARPHGPSPKATAATAGGLVSPQSKSLGLDQSEQSPAVQRSSPDPRRLARPLFATHPGQP